MTNDEGIEKNANVCRHLNIRACFVIRHSDFVILPSSVAKKIRVASRNISGS